MHPIYLIHIKFDTDFITTPFKFIYNSNIIIFIIFNTMDTHTRTTNLLLIVVTFYFKLLISSIILYCNFRLKLHYFCILFIYFFFKSFQFFFWNSPNSFCRDLFVTSGFIKLSKQSHTSTAIDLEHVVITM